MLAYYGDRISPHMTTTPEGYLVCHDVPIARTGQYLYTAGELGLDGDPGRAVEVWRSEEEVFSPAAMASFEGKPVTDNHPPENVGPANHGAYARGHAENIRRHGDYLLADLYINDATLAEEIRGNTKREVSCGYLCTYEPAGNGYRQTHHPQNAPRGGSHRQRRPAGAGGRHGRQRAKTDFRRSCRKSVLSICGYKCPCLPLRWQFGSERRYSHYIAVQP